MSNRIQELKTLLAEKPLAREFLELARLLSESQANRIEARDVLFKGINHHPNHFVARLLLAKLFFEDGMFAFSARELAELWLLNKSITVKSLLDSFGEHGKYYNELFQGKTRSISSEDVLAEIDLDSDFADALSEIEEED